jgi:hypothetical protein
VMRHFSRGSVPVGSFSRIVMVSARVSIDAESPLLLRSFRGPCVGCSRATVA